MSGHSTVLLKTVRLFVKLKQNSGVPGVIGGAGVDRDWETQGYM